MGWFRFLQRPGPPCYLDDHRCFVPAGRGRTDEKDVSHRVISSPWGGGGRQGERLQIRQERERHSNRKGEGRTDPETVFLKCRTSWLLMKLSPCRDWGGNVDAFASLNAIFGPEETPPPGDARTLYTLTPGGRLPWPLPS